MFGKADAQTKARWDDEWEMRSTKVRKIQQIFEHLKESVRWNQWHFVFTGHIWPLGFKRCQDHPSVVKNFTEIGLSFPMRRMRAERSAKQHAMTSADNLLTIAEQMGCFQDFRQPWKSTDFFSYTGPNPPCHQVRTNSVHLKISKGLSKVSQGPWTLTRYSLATPFSTFGSTLDWAKVFKLQISPYPHQTTLK